MGKYCLHIYIKSFNSLKGNLNFCPGDTERALTFLPSIVAVILSLGTDLPSVNIMFFAAPDPPTDPRHRLNQANQHPDPLSSAQFLSNISPSDSSATLSTLRK